MRTVRIVLCGALLVALAVVGAGALDWGGTVDNSTAYYTGGGGYWEQKDKAALWLAADLGPNLALEARGSYTYDLDRPYLFDLEKLALSGQVPGLAGESSVLRWSVGRVPLRQGSGTTLGLTADGFDVTLGLPRIGVELAAAYTGLMLKPVANVNISNADFTDNGDDDVFFAPKRLVGLLEARFPELFARQTLTAAALLQQDLRSDEAARLSTQYFLLGLGGPVVSGVYYDASATLSTGRDAALADPALLALLVEGGVRYFNRELLSARFELRGLYASGDSGAFTAYLPVTAPTLGLVYAPALGGRARVQASASVKPLESLQALLKATVWMSTTGAGYTGTEVEAGANWRPFSDLGGALALGLWAPSGGGDLQYGAKLDVSFAF